MSLWTEMQLTFQDFVNLLFAIGWTRTLIAFFEGTTDVPDVDAPIIAQPIIDMGDGISEATTVEIPVGNYIVSERGVGSPFQVGTYNGLSLIGQYLETMMPTMGLSITEFSSIVRDNIDGDDDDSDVVQILNEILTGESGANFDFETEPGIDGVELVGITRETYTIELTSLDFGQKDRLTFAGPGTAAIVAQFDADADIVDSANAISLVDLGANETVIVGNVLEDLIGNSFNGLADAETLWNVAQEGHDSRVTLLRSEADSFSVRIDNNNGFFDYLVFYDSISGLDFLK